MRAHVTIPETSLKTYAASEKIKSAFRIGHRYGSALENRFPRAGSLSAHDVVRQVLRSCGERTGLAKTGSGPVCGRRGCVA